MHTVLKWPALELQHSGSQDCRDRLAHRERSSTIPIARALQKHSEALSCTLENRAREVFITAVNLDTL